MSTDRILREGDKWHLHSKDSVYSIYTVLWDGVVLITCDKWKREFERKERKLLWERVKPSDLKCKMGARSIHKHGNSYKNERQAALNKLTPRERELLKLI